ncbi:TPA: hypothetical protein ACFP4I_001972, partial [Neisseria subflava]
TVDVFGDHGLCGLPEEGAHGKSPKCLGGNLGDFGEFCKGLRLFRFHIHNNPKSKLDVFLNSENPIKNMP